MGIKAYRDPFKCFAAIVGHVGNEHDVITFGEDNGLNRTVNWTLMVPVQSGTNPDDRHTEDGKR